MLVTKGQFFATIGHLDVMPRDSRPESTDWETPGRERLGWSAPGWRNPSAHKTVYALRAAAAAGPQAQPNEQEALAQTIAQQNGKGTA